MSSRARFAVSALATSTLAVAVAFAGAVAPAPEAAAADGPGKAGVRVLECSTGKKQKDRWAIFRAKMSATPTSSRMRMRFSLSEKVGTSPWRGMTLGDWHSALPGVSKFAYNQRVKGLKPATIYRARVEFAWVDDEGHVILRRIKESRSCRQRGKLPNLAFRDDVSIGPGPTVGTARYAFRIHNNGLTRSRASSLALRVNGTEVDAKPIGRLRSRERRTVSFVGPVCARGIEARLDPAGAIREITERDNVLKAGCG